MKKILFVSSTLEAGGVQHILANLSLQLQEVYDVTILLNDTQKVQFPYGGEIIDLGLPQSDNRSGIGYQLRAYLRRYRKLRKLKRRGGYDYCISMLDSSNVANILTGKRYCKVITTVYTNLSGAAQQDSIYKYIVTPLVKILYNRSDSIVVTSEAVRQDLYHSMGLAKSRMVVIYDGVDIQEIRDKIRSLESEPMKRKTEEIICTLGRLSLAKGQWHLIRSMRKVKERCPNAKLLIIGGGELKERLQQLISEEKLNDVVTLCGYVDNPYEMIAESDAFVMSSILEGYPTVLLEAMVCGAPCICTDFESGAREILAPDTDINSHSQNEIEHAKYGVLTPVCDGKWRDAGELLTREEELLADAIVEMITNKELQNKYRKQVELCAKNFSMESCARKWQEVLEAL